MNDPVEPSDETARPADSARVLSYARPMPASGFVKVASFLDQTEAELARNKLEAEGIRCILGGEELRAGVGSVIGTRMDLRVFEGDVDRAKQILADVEAVRAARLAALRAPAAAKCPSCGSTNIRRNFSRAWLGIILLLIGVIGTWFGEPIVLVGGLVIGCFFIWTTDRTRWTCNACGHRWLPTKRDDDQDDRDDDDDDDEGDDASIPSAR